MVGEIPHEQGLFCLGVVALQGCWAIRLALMRRYDRPFAGAPGEGSLLESVRLGRADVVLAGPNRKLKKEGLILYTVLPSFAGY